MPEIIPQLVQEGETPIQQDPQGNWAIVQKVEGSRVMRVKTPNGILEQPLAQPAAAAPMQATPTQTPQATSAVPTVATTAASSQANMVKTMEYVAAGEAAVGIAAAGASLLEDFFKKK